MVLRVCVTLVLESGSGNVNFVVGFVLLLHTKEVEMGICRCAGHKLFMH